MKKWETCGFVIRKRDANHSRRRWIKAVIHSGIQVLHGHIVQLWNISGLVNVVLCIVACILCEELVTGRTLVLSP